MKVYFPVAAATVLLTLASCASSSAEPQADATPVAEQISNLLSGVSLTESLYGSALEATPLTTFVVDGVEYPAVSDLFVYGLVKAVEPGVGYSWPDGPQIEGGPSTQKAHPFNSPEAWISTVSISVSIEGSTATESKLQSLDSVRFGLSVPSPTNLDSIREELVGTQIAVMLVENDETPFVDDPELFGVVGYGEMLGFVTEQKTVEFPNLSLERLRPGEDARRAPEPIPLVQFMEPPSIVELKMVDDLLVRI